MKTTNKSHSGIGRKFALAACAVAACATAQAGTYTWMSSPADGNWNTTSLNWNSGEAWVDDAASPNDATFSATSSYKTISIPSGETRHVRNMTVDEAGYTFGGNGSIGLTGTMTINKSSTIRSLIDAKKASGLDFSTSTAVKYTHQTEGQHELDPGAGRTNIVGRLYVRNRLKIASGVTRLGIPQNATGENALLFIQGNYNTFSSFIGRLEVAGGTLYASQNFYVDVEQYGQVTVTDRGKVYMPNVEWLNGLYNPGRLTVANGGEFTVGALRICSNWASQINLNEGGLIAVARLAVTRGNTNQAKFLFNGGRIQSRDGRSAFLSSADGTAPTEEQWSTAVKFAVGEGGAVFDTSNGYNLWWSRPLVSDAAHDGGVRKIGDEILVFTHTNGYNGVTCVEAGGVQLRVDNALPPGSTVRLGSANAYIDGWTFDSASPARETEQWLRRVEGNGYLSACVNMHVTNSVAPATNGTLMFRQTCDLRGDYEIAADANGCGLLEVRGANQSISNLTLKVADFSALDRNAPGTRYQILAAPNGYTGAFALPSDWPEAWNVHYDTKAVYLRAITGTTIVIR